MMEINESGYEDTLLKRIVKKLFGANPNSFFAYVPEVLVLILMSKIITVWILGVDSLWQDWCCLNL